MNSFTNQKQTHRFWNKFMVTKRKHWRQGYIRSLGLIPMHCCCCCCWVASVVSDSVQPHRRQPTRLRCPWDSPGRNTGVGCHFLLQCVKVKSLSRVRLLVTPWTAAFQAPLSMGFSRQEYWSGVPLTSLIHPWACYKSSFILQCHRLFTLSGTLGPQRWGPSKQAASGNGFNTSPSKGICNGGNISC